MRLFVAGPGACREYLGQIIRNRLPQLGHTAYDWTSDPGWDNPEDHNPAKAAVRDLSEIEKAEAVIWYLDGIAPSHGAPFEVGYAIGIGKPVGVWCTNEDLPPEWIYASWLGFSMTLTGAIEVAMSRGRNRDEEPAGRPIGSIPLWTCNQRSTYIWDAEHTKKLLQALEAKTCRLVDLMSERLDNLSDRVDRGEEASRLQRKWMDSWDYVLSLPGRKREAEEALEQAESRLDEFVDSVISELEDAISARDAELSRLKMPPGVREDAIHALYCSLSDLETGFAAGPIRDSAISDVRAAIAWLEGVEG